MEFTVPKAEIERFKWFEGENVYEKFAMLQEDGFFEVERLQMRRVMELPSMAVFSMSCIIGVPIGEEKNGMHKHFVKESARDYFQLFDCASIFENLYGSHLNSVVVAISILGLALWWMLGMKCTKIIKEKVQWDYKRYMKDPS